MNLVYSMLIRNRMMMMIIRFCKMIWSSFRHGNTGGLTHVFSAWVLLDGSFSLFYGRLLQCNLHNSLSLSLSFSLSLDDDDPTTTITTSIYRGLGVVPMGGVPVGEA